MNPLKVSEWLTLGITIEREGWLEMATCRLSLPSFDDEAATDSRA